jgi:hypothetical protein
VHRKSIRGRDAGGNLARKEREYAGWQRVEYWSQRPYSPVVLTNQQALSVDFWPDVRVRIFYASIFRYQRAQVVLYRPLRHPSEQ